MTSTNAQIVFVAGLSGSGKSTATAALEDLGFYCVDNLPAQLIFQFLDLCKKATPPIEKVALAVDTREGHFLRQLPQALEELQRGGAEVQLIFLDCSDDILVNRYRETRRVHPMAPVGSVEDGIVKERQALADLIALADIQIDTSALNIHQLKETIIASVSGDERQTIVNLVSFGFRYTVPSNVEFLFDVRLVRNPYFVEELRPKSGCDVEVAQYVLQSERGESLLEKVDDLLTYLLPLYDREGKAYVTLGIGCTGGRHRSVAITEELASRLRSMGRDVNVEHRDLERV